MTLPTLKEIENLASIVEHLPDDRPAILRDLPSANDNTALYYRFFHEFVKRWAPLNILEIGTYRGTSAAHLAYANKDGRVLTADIVPDAVRFVDELRLPNLRAVLVDSYVPYEEIESVGKSIDVIFVDAYHTFNDAYDQYTRYRPFLRPGGIMFFDDLELKMGGDQMRVFWEFVKDPKVSLKGLHYTGFGAAERDFSFTPPPWEKVIKDATLMMKERGL